MGMVLRKKGEVPARLLRNILHLYRGWARFSLWLFPKRSRRLYGSFQFHLIESEVDDLAFLLLDCVLLTKVLPWIDAECFKCRRNLLTQFVLVLE
jgi:hypothetical protein